jgi:hypothetical protein
MKTSLKVYRQELAFEWRKNIPPHPDLTSLGLCNDLQHIGFEMQDSL